MSEGVGPPLVIKRKKIIAGGGHHGGAWKVAYADFVTAMMAFFMLMWLLNATTEKQRKGIADYFNPTIPVNRISGGGDGMFGGDSIFSDYTLARSGTGGRHERSNIATHGHQKQISDEEKQELERLSEQLLGSSGESDVADPLKRHVATRVTDRGLVVELFDAPEAPLFDRETASLTSLGTDLIGAVHRVFGIVENGIAVHGHLASRPIVLARNPNWDLSTKRAHAVREAFENSGTDPNRILRVVGEADRNPSVIPEISERNNRIEIILLRSGA